MNAEQQRLEEDRLKKQPWRKWGPYLSERQWGTVREDYSPGGTAWDYLAHDAARSRAYRWGEDGLAGFSDDQQRLCLALALWNGQDPILKERIFGLTNSEGNHGEDVKELYYYLDATPTHSYLKMLYKYPQRAFPYGWLVEENRRRGKGEMEFELIDTGVFDDDRYFDVFVEYAKAGPEDVLLQITVHNRGPQAAPLHLLPQIWFRDTWSWQAHSARPALAVAKDGSLAASHAGLGNYYLYHEDPLIVVPPSGGSPGKPPEGGTTNQKCPALLFCDNETNMRRLYNCADARGYFKDGFHDYLIQGNQEAVNPAQTGTKAAAHYFATVPAGGTARARLRLTNAPAGKPFASFDTLLNQRKSEADAFYAELQADVAGEDARNVQRQALAGMIWSKQFFHYNVRQWLQGDPGQPAPPPQRLHGRNCDWQHLNNADVLSMPDKWEYPWYAAWDLTFHCVTLALVDPAFAKNQLLLLTHEWYMHPNGQLPAYEWAFGDVNPPVHAWAAWRVFQIERRRQGGTGDLAFLEQIFIKLLLNFTWWVNRKDVAGRDIFQGGFLGLDNISIFNRSAPLPTGGYLNQVDGTAWMAMYCLNLMRIALELALHNPVYEDIATKFFEHFLQIAEAMTRLGGADGDTGLWDEEDKFFHSVLSLPDGRLLPLKIDSMVGLIPLFAVETLEPDMLDKLPAFAQRLQWFLDHRPGMAKLVSHWDVPGQGKRRLLSLLRGHRMKKILERMLDPAEFLSDYGVRAVSKKLQAEPYVFHWGAQSFSVNYEPGESESGEFGGNSNWRGPIWFPVNFLIVESLQKFHYYYGDNFKIECPTGSKNFFTIDEVARELSRRLTRIFLRDDKGRRPVFGRYEKMQTDPHFRDCLLFHEYFHGDNGRGVGASHQTGWTGLVAKLLQPRRPETSVGDSEAGYKKP